MNLARLIINLLPLELNYSLLCNPFNRIKDSTRLNGIYWPYSNLVILQERKYQQLLVMDCPL